MDSPDPIASALQRMAREQEDSSDGGTDPSWTGAVEERIRCELNRRRTVRARRRVLLPAASLVLLATGIAAGAGLHLSGWRIFVTEHGDEELLTFIDEEQGQGFSIPVAPGEGEEVLDHLDRGGSLRTLDGDSESGLPAHPEARRLLQELLEKQAGREVMMQFQLPDGRVEKRMMRLPGKSADADGEQDGP